MGNRETAKAWEYHERTKHSPRSVRESTHFLDWENEPLLFKIYRDREPIPLPLESGRAGMPALEAICSGPPKAAEHVPSLKDLATVFHFAAGITRRRSYARGEILFRAASCTGALYEIELYLACGALEGLGPGLYHFNPADNALRRLRSGDWRGVLVHATARESSVAQAPAVVISTGTYWRNAWKYRERAYRHFGWDNGTLHANLLATARALGLPARLVCGFVDEEVNRLLGLDTSREVSLALAALGEGAPAPEPPSEMPPLEFETEPVSRRERDFPLMREMHAASSLMSPEEVAAWRSEAAPDVPAAESEPSAGDSIEEVILRRGSSRRFAREPIRQADLSRILANATCGLAADFSPPGRFLNELYLIAHAVEGLKPGAYHYDTSARGLEALKYGEFRREAAFLALDQDLAGDAAVAVFFLADLDRWLARFGNRGYRAAQLEAGLLGGRLYLGAYALRLGATGLTFYDDEVTRFFSPHAEGKSAIFLTAIGHRARRPRAV